ncbi:MAG TPA: AAA family ATPase [Candidatus Acidoferrales bacterium]|nr:AAA family ATPase [Candidatus Acidoferrales bacterium]
MGSLLGRDPELIRARAVLESAAHGQIVRALRIVGSSGVGKTALALELGREATADGWLVVYAPSFRIHAGLPLFAARRVVGALLEALGDSADRYRSGLTLERDRPEDFEEAFLRIVEGVALDHRLLLILDDAQWADPQSRALIERTAAALADRAIVLLSTERSDELSAPAFVLADEAIALGELSPQTAVQLVRAIYPDVSDEVAAGIAEQTRGRAVDVVAVATAARENNAATLRDVVASTRRLIARDLALLDGNSRTFLQLCALIEEPIEPLLLQQFWSQDELLPMIEQVSGRYLVSEGDALYFVHATVIESVRETIPIEIPLRYRIIDALKKLPSPRLEDYERLAKQCAACGDRAAEREALLKLSDAAAAESMLALAADALERAVTLAPPQGAEITPAYERLAQLYNVTGRQTDAIRACRRGLAEAQAAGVTDGIGALAASIAMAQCNSGLAQEARATIARYEDVVSSAERALLYSVGEFAAFHTADFESADDFRARYERCAADATPLAAIRHHVSNAFLAMRRGDEQRALESITDAESAIARAPALFGMMGIAAKIFCTFGYRGIEPTERFIGQLAQGRRLPPVALIEGHLMIARGELNDVEELLADKLSLCGDSSTRRILMGARCAAAAFRELDPDSPIWQPAYPEIAAFETGERRPTLLPIVVAALTPLARRSPKRATALVEQTLAVAAGPFDLTAIVYPELLVNAARTLGAKDALEAIASGALWADNQPLNRAHHFLARGIAAAAIGSAGHRDLLADARERFIAMGAPFFADLAARAAEKSTASVSVGRTRPNSTTRREFEIAGLVSQGLTNREIAERLVLSERTIEGHIANLFAKVNVNSRTQLATWFMRTTSSVA